MPLQATSGAASQDGFGGNGVPIIRNYIEEVFSTNLWQGNDTTQTITNGINLSTEGGLVWVKSRNTTYGHILSDTIRGTGKHLASNEAATQTTDAQNITAFNTTGFTIGNNASINNPSFNYVGWTFRKQPKFFDIVTFIATSGKDQRISHSLGSVPGCIIIKPINTGGGWYVYHRSLTGGGNAYRNVLSLEGTGAAGTYSGSVGYWGSSNPTSTTFGVSDELLYDGGTDASRTYIAYIFAHDAGGFGAAGTDNVISCGSFTTDGSGAASVNLGYEPQWVMQKRTDSSTGGNWYIADNMRRMTVAGSRGLFPNLTDAEEGSDQGPVVVNATGFTASRFANATYIYVAIRRGPMRAPTDATKVFTPSYGLNAGANGQAWNAGFPVDMYIRANPTAVDFYTSDRLRNPLNYLLIDSTAEESTVAFSDRLDNNIGVFSTNAYDYRTWIGWQFRRASSFFDEVCYTGNGASNRVINHNLGVAPELIIRKQRNGADDWNTQAVGPLTYSSNLKLNGTDANATNGATYLFSSGNASTLTTGSIPTYINESGFTYVAYLFATCDGVSKVGSYTGTGTTLQINCGFTAGARFVLIKRTDSTGDWYVWDSARGIIAGNDPYLLLNSSNSEVTNTDYIDSYSPGFELSSTAPAAINANGGTFIFLAIA
jgi:hypothetical protein